MLKGLRQNCSEQQVKRCLVMDQKVQAMPAGKRKTLSVNPVVNVYLFQIREGKSKERVGMGSTFRMLCQKDSGPVTLTRPMATRL